MLRRLTAALILVTAVSVPTFAQSTTDSRPASAAELLVGYAGFADDATIDHTVVGGAARVYLSPRVAVGPELVFMRGPGSDRDLMLTGNLTFDLLRPRQGKPPRVSPFLVAGGGLFRHTDRFGGASFSSSEGAFTAGGGTRVWFTDRVYGVADFRVGWELHYRVNGGIGIALGK